MTTFQYYTGGIKSVKPKGEVNIDRFYKAIKETKPQMLKLLNDIAEASYIGDETLKNYLKTKLIFFTPAINCTYRNYESIVNFTGIAPLDFDKLPDESYSVEFKKHLFYNHEEIMACWLSSSRKGVRAFVKIPVCNNVEEYQSYYNAFIDTFDVYNGFDTAPKNAVLPLFLSNDENILIRDNAKEWTKKHIPKPKKPQIRPLLIYDDKKLDSIYNNARKSLNRISNAGHPILRATAFTIGGYVGSGYITDSEAETFIHNEIETHHYLSADKNKIKTYKKTASEMIQKGKLNPLEL